MLPTGKFIYMGIGFKYFLGFIGIVMLSSQIAECRAQVISMGDLEVGQVTKKLKIDSFQKIGFTSQLINHKSYSNVKEKHSYLKSKGHKKFNFEIGDGEEFYVRNVTTGDTWDKVHATLGYKETGINIWFQTSAYDTLLGSAEFFELLAGLDSFLFKSTPSSSVNPAKGILEILKEYVGEFPDVDGDQKLDVLILDIRDNFSETGSYVAGFFDPVNLYEHEFSNERDLVYLDLYPTLLYNGELNIERALATLAHESQHLIHAGYEGEQIESVFVNEGFSEATEIICGFEPRSAKAFLQYPIKGLTEWNHKNPLTDYSRASLWMHYVLEQLGHNNLKHFVQNPQTGIDGYKTVIESISGFTFKEIFQNWGLALALNDIDQDPRFGYKHDLRKHLLLSPQIAFSNLPVIYNEELPDFINIPIHFPLTKDLELNLGLPSVTETQFSSFSTYPGSDEIDVQINNQPSITVRANKSDYGTIDVLLSNFGSFKSDAKSEVSFMVDGVKSGRHLSLGFGNGIPEKFYRNASYLMLDGEHEKLGVVFPPNESGYWLKDFELWTLFKSELEGSGVDADEKRDFEVSIYTFKNGRPDKEIISPIVIQAQREFGKLVSERFHLSDFYGKLSAIEDTLMIVFGNDADDENYISLGMSQGEENASYFSNSQQANWVSLSEKRVGGNALENWNPVLKLGIVVPESEQYYVSSIQEIKYDFEKIQLNIQPKANYDSSTVHVSAQLPDGSFKMGKLISKEEDEFLFGFPVLVDGDYTFLSSYKTSDGKITHRDKKEWSVNIPNGFELSKNYPNPFNPSTTIPFLLLEEANISWEVFDVTGKLVLEIPAQTLSSGEHYRKIDLSGYASGLYIVRAILKRKRSNTIVSKTQKIVLIK